MRLFSKSRATTRHSTFFQVREALDRGGCPVCRLSLGSVAGYLDSLAYESVNDPNLRNQLRSSRGFCPRHAWQFLAVGSGPFAVAIIYADVLSEVTGILEPASRRLRSTRSCSDASNLELASRLAPQQPCPVCRLLAESRDRYLSTLVEHLPEHDFAAAYRASQGLCLPHLERAISQTADVDVRHVLLETALHTLEKAPASQGIAGAGAILQRAEFLSGADGSLMECPTRPASWARPPKSNGQVLLQTGLGPLGEQSCVLCEESRDSASDVVASLLPLAGSCRLCDSHLRSVLETARSDDASRLFEEGKLRLIRRLREDSYQTAGKPGALDRLLEMAHRWLSPPGERSDEVCCEAGAHKVQAQSGQAAAFAEALIAADRGDAFLRSPGLCFTHLLLGLASASPEGASVLVETELAKLRGLVAELNEYVRKHDYRFAHEPWGEEASSPWRAVRKVAGAEGAWGVGGLWAPGGTGS